MYLGRLVGEKFLIIHNGECLVCQTPENYGSLERIRRRVALTLIYAFFVKQDGDYLAELKANKLWKFVKAHLPKDLNFEIGDAALREVIEKTISEKSPEWFGVYCELTVVTDGGHHLSVMNRVHDE